jgi:cardiolipin synthase
VRKTKTEKRPEQERLVTHYRWLFILAMISLLVVVSLLFLLLFEPPLPFVVSWSPRERNDTPRFLRTIYALTNGWLDRATSAEVLTNGERFYPAELAAIRGARRSVHATAYIMSPGKVAAEYVAALTERARAGIEVKLVLDALGSNALNAAAFKPLMDAKGRVAWYRPLKWYTWTRIGNRSHRELLVIDGKTAFIGGAGVADHWLIGSKDKPRWRDMMLRVEGAAVTGLEASFAENWLEAAGEILADSDDTPPAPATGPATSLVVTSTPTMGRFTPARILFQTLLASASKRIRISTPYFLPDHALRDEIARAAHERHVEVKIIVPGGKTDHWMVWHASRRLYGDLLRSGVQIYEYQPSMNHTKCMTVDGIWSVVGSTNMDTRSFGINDEVNLALRDPALAARLEQDFTADLARSQRVTYDEWRRRGFVQRFQEYFGALFERQE